jgi:hypothetical protein
LNTKLCRFTPRIPDCMINKTCTIFWLRWICRYGQRIHPLEGRSSAYREGVNWLQLVR